MSEYFHLAVAWDWEFDREFVRILEQQVHAQRLLFYSVSHHNALETARCIQSGELKFGAFLDRASESDEKFIPLSKALRKSSTLYINPQETVEHAIDKATMHLEFMTKGIDVPYTIIISPYNKKSEVELSLTDLAQLGRPFIIKPANTTGGGIGVITGAETLKDVIESRQHHKNDKYLLQKKIIPAPFEGRRGWFRVFYVFGLILPCWWDDQTHIYHMITQTEVRSHGLRSLITITKKIFEVCGMDFFSTEIAITEEKKFVVVDYVNDLCDMRVQSQHVDGVPDLVVAEIARRIAKHVKVAVK